MVASFPLNGSVPGNRLALWFSERTDCIDICLRNEMLAVLQLRRLGKAGRCLGPGSRCHRVDRGLSEES